MIGSTAVNVTAQSHCPSSKANLSQHPTQAAQSLPALRNCCSLPNVSLRPQPAVLPLQCLMGKYLERNDLRGEMLCIFVKKLSKRKNPNAREERKWLCCFGLGYLRCWRHLELAWPGNPAPPRCLTLCCWHRFTPPAWVQCKRYGWLQEFYLPCTDLTYIWPIN